MNHLPIHDAVAAAITKVLQDSGRPVPELSSDATINETLKLDSLDLAVVVVALESQLGVDPFRDGAHPIRTFGDLVAVYDVASHGKNK